MIVEALTEEGKLEKNWTGTDMMRHIFRIAGSPRHRHSVLPTSSVQRAGHSKYRMKRSPKVLRDTIRFGRLHSAKQASNGFGCKILRPDIAVTRYEVSADVSPRNSTDGPEAGRGNPVQRPVRLAGRARLADKTVELSRPGSVMDLHRIICRLRNC